VILVDANLLIYAYDPSAPQHARAQAWLEAQFTGSASVGLPWATILAFVRVSTNPRLRQPAVPLADAWRAAQSWLDLPPVWIPDPTERHRTVLGDMLGHSGAGANLVTDAHLAALAIEHGLILCSTDGDFARFPGLRWQNPIAR
jgi:toxin-antitoxin system PIN domain toxin